MYKKNKFIKLERYLSGLCFERYVNGAIAWAMSNSMERAVIELNIEQSATLSSDNG